MSTAKHAQEPLRLSGSEVASMRAVANGADVLAYGIACDLRAVQQRYPDLVNMGPRMGRYGAEERLPYFGAILTPKGRAAIATDKRCSRCRETWPATTEFFRNRTGSSCRFFSWCRGCEADHRREKRLAASRAHGEAFAAIANATRSSS